VHLIIGTVVQASFFALEFCPKLSQMLVTRASAGRLALALALLAAACRGTYGGIIDNSNFCEVAADLQNHDFGGMPHMPRITLGGEENSRIEDLKWNDCAAASDDLLFNGLRSTSWNDVTCEQISKTTYAGRPVRTLIPPSCCGGQATVTAAAPAGGKIVTPTAKRSETEDCVSNGLDNDIYIYPVNSCVTRCADGAALKLISAPPSIATGVSKPTVTAAVWSSEATVTDCQGTGHGSEDDCGCTDGRPEWSGDRYKCVKCPGGDNRGQVGPNHTKSWKCFPSVRSNQNNTKLITKWSVIQCESSNGQLTDAVASEAPAVSRQPTITDCPNHGWKIIAGQGYDDLNELSRECGCSDDQHVGMVFPPKIARAFGGGMASPKCFKCPNDAPNFFYSHGDTVETPQCYMNCPTGKEYFCSKTMGVSQSR